MSVFYEAKIGYGYPISGDDFPDYDYDDEESINRYYIWQDQFRESTYCHYMNYNWDFDCYFFGIMVESVECGQFLKMSDVDLDDYIIDQKEWAECEKEYHELFPNSEQKPDFYLMCVVW